MEDGGSTSRLNKDLVVSWISFPIRNRVFISSLPVRDIVTEAILCCRNVWGQVLQCNMRTHS